MDIQPADVVGARAHVQLMLRLGCAELDHMERWVEDRFSQYSTERRARLVLAYLLAAEAMLAAVPELHSEMMELPDMVRLRALQRRFK